MAAGARNRRRNQGPPSTRQAHMWSPPPPAGRRVSQGEFSDHVAEDRRDQVATRPAPQGEQQAGGGHGAEEGRRVRERGGSRPQRGAAGGRNRRAGTRAERGG